ncbi:Phosphatidylinositide phosphatase SAC1-like protein, partial [Leptotrombidium deliense]
YTTPDKFLIRPTNAVETIVIDRISHDINGISNSVDNEVQSATGKLVHAIFGIVHLLAGPYLIVVTKASKVAQIFNSPIMRVDETELLSYCKTTWHLTNEQVQHNNAYLAMIKTVLNTPHFYFSYSYDLSHTLQRLQNSGPDFLSASICDRADTRFVWNRFLSNEFLHKVELKRFCVPFIHGFIASESVTKFSFTIISRRSATRAGTRMFSRGIDNEGNVSNFVETEQIIEYGNTRSSLVQIRGSIPLFWTQLPNLYYKPAPMLSPLNNHADALYKHIDNLICHYGKVVLINLVNHSGQEQPLENEFKQNVLNLNNALVRYESFDFHKECKKMRWDRLSILMNRINQEQIEFGYFLSSDDTVLSTQDGVFRTNCIDSLDRTNVVQSLIAKKSLDDQLRKFNVLAHGESIDDHHHFADVYRNVWADNADMCSIQYAGTGALKTDFTRTGKRTKTGLVKDGLNSLIRYYKNNFADGFRQACENYPLKDGIDLFLGKYRPDENEGKLHPSPLTDKKDWKYLVLPTILLGSLAMFFFSIFIPTEHSTETFMYLIFWSGMVSFSLAVIVYYGTEFVDFPKLCEVRR